MVPTNRSSGDEVQGPFTGLFLLPEREVSP